MRRIYLLLFLISSVISARSQSLLNEGFEGTSFPPAGWTILKAGGNNWTSNTDNNLQFIYPTHTGEGSMVYEYNENAAANAWAITPALSLTANVSYSISFAYRIADPDFPEKLKVTVGNAATIAAQSTIIWNNNAASQLTNTRWQIGLIKYTPTTTGNFYFGFNCYSLKDEFALMIDDISVEASAANVPPCTTNTLPAAGAVNVSNPVTLSWNAAAGATSYDLYIGSANPPTTIFNNYTSISTQLTTAFNTTYYWYVSPRNNAGSATGCASSITSFTTGAVPVAPACANLLTPANNAVNVSVTTNFTWNATPGATSYEFYFGTTASPDSLGSTTDTSVALVLALNPNTTYYWRAVPQNAGGRAIDCPTYSFTTGDLPDPPPCTTLITPANGAANVNDTTEFSWNSVAGATDYAVIIGTTNPPTDTLGTTTDTSTTLIIPQYNTTYYWYIAPLNAGGLASGCTVDSFTTGAAPLSPACATLISPASGEVNVSATPATFYWNSVPSAVGYIFLAGTDPNALDTITATADTTIDLKLSFDTKFYWSIVPGNGGGYASGCAVDSFTSKPAPAVPANDDCTGAVQLFANGAPVTGYTYSATLSMDAEPCDTLLNGDPNLGDANDDVWYKFTAIKNGDASFTLSPDGDFDGVMMAYSGDCNSLNNIGCADIGIGGDPETLELTGLTAGSTYYFRVYGYEALGQFGEGSFTLTTSGTALPVTLADFRGERNGSKNVLTWTTQTEQDSKGFELQRSIDGKNYATLSFIPSAAVNGNSSTRLSYSYADMKPFNANCYYRLKQVAKDGRSTLSQVVLLKGLKPNTLELSNVYPNPSKNELNIVLRSPVNEKVKVMVTDLAGKLVMERSAQLVTGDNNLSLTVSSLPAGSYMIKAVCTNGCETAVSKFVKQ